MKKLYKKSSVHPSSPPPISTHLALLPAAIFTLTLTLSPEDKEILAYLISSTTKKTATATTDHSPLFNCSCFRCYMSYWVRWDSSPNRHLIHQIIDAFEDTLLLQNKTKKHSRKTKKLLPNTNTNINEAEDTTVLVESAELTRSLELSELKVNEFKSAAECEDGAVRKLVSFIGERIWSVWT